MWPAKTAFRVISLIIVLTTWMLATPDAPSAYGHLPLSFESNRGQATGDVTYLSRGDGQTLLLKQDKAELILAGESVQFQFLGASGNSKVQPRDRQPGVSHYYVSADPKEWLTNIPNYGSVEYSNLYPGIDLIYHGEA